MLPLKDDSKVTNLGDWENGGILNRHREVWIRGRFVGGIGMGEKIISSVLDMLNLKCLRCSGNVQQTVKFKEWNS